MERIDIRITTKTNLFIGDTPSTFEIGGIDAATKINYQGLPVIPASSFKGVLKRIIRDMAAADNQQAKKIEDAAGNGLICFTIQSTETFFSAAEHEIQQ